MKKTLIYILSTLIIFSFAGCKSTEVAVQEQPVQEPVEETVDEAEYLRSIDKIEGEVVTKQEFEEDKAEILRIISELSVVMEKGDYESWLDYIAPESINYYSNPQNIRKAQKKLPDKTIMLNGTKDYFKYVFIPSRKRSQVDEIRYISKENIKAVQVKDDDSVIIYYYFVKINGKWLVHIPPLN